MVIVSINSKIIYCLYAKSRTERCSLDKKALTIAIWLINIFGVLLVGFAVALPWAVTWYVETMGRSQTLPAIIMVTCYPCVPFVAGILLYLRRIIRNILKDMLFHLDNVTYFNRISIFCIFISVITFIGGKFYLPFLIVGTTFCFFSFLTFVYKTVFLHIAKEIDKE